MEYIDIEADDASSNDFHDDDNDKDNEHRDSDCDFIDDDNEDIFGDITPMNINIDEFREKTSRQRAASRENYADTDTENDAERRRFGLTYNEWAEADQTNNYEALITKFQGYNRDYQEMHESWKERTCDVLTQGYDDVFRLASDFVGENDSDNDNDTNNSYDLNTFEGKTQAFQEKNLVISSIIDNISGKDVDPEQKQALKDEHRKVQRNHQISNNLLKVVKQLGDTASMYSDEYTPIENLITAIKENQSCKELSFPQKNDMAYQVVISVLNERKLTYSSVNGIIYELKKVPGNNRSAQFYAPLTMRDSAENLSVMNLKHLLDQWFYQGCETGPEELRLMGMDAGGHGVKGWVYESLMSNQVLKKPVGERLLFTFKDGMIDLNNFIDKDKKRICVPQFYPWDKIPPSWSNRVSWNGMLHETIFGQWSQVVNYDPDTYKVIGLTENWTTRWKQPDLEMIGLTQGVEWGSPMHNFERGMLGRTIVPLKYKDPKTGILGDNLTAAVVHYGLSGTGKTMLTDMIADASYDSQDVVRMRDSSGSNFSVSEIENKKLVIFDDATTNSKIPIDLWVTLPEGGQNKSIQGERKYQDAKSILVEQPLLVTTNVGLPHNKDASRMDRRYVIIPFLNQPQSRNDALREQLLKHHKGNFMVHCWMLYQNELRSLIETRDNFQGLVSEIDSKFGNQRYSLARTMCLEQDESAALIIKAVMALNKENSSGQRVLDIYPGRKSTHTEVYISLAHLKYLVVKYYVEIEGMTKPPDLDAGFDKFATRFGLGYKRSSDFNESTKWPPLPCTEGEEIRNMDSIFLCGIGVHKTIVNYKAQPLDATKALVDLRNKNKSGSHNNNYNNNYNNNNDPEVEETRYWLPAHFDGIVDYFGNEDFFFDKIQFSFLNAGGGRILRSFRFNQSQITDRLKSIRDRYQIAFDRDLNEDDPFAMAFIRSICGQDAIFDSNHVLTNLKDVLETEIQDPEYTDELVELKVKQVPYDNEMASLSLFMSD